LILMPVSLRASGSSLPSALRALPSPTLLRLPDLLRVADQEADLVLTGRYDHLFPARGIPADERWFARLHSDDELDVWLISWVPEKSTELHDHSGSLGAMTLLSGALHESRWAGDQLRGRQLNAGDQAAFPLGWVHDVTWAPGDFSSSGSTLSVHAYAPPLTAMSYYDITPRNTLRRIRTELTDTPEG
jgi:hypothetical protein